MNRVLATVTAIAAAATATIAAGAAGAALTPALAAPRPAHVRTVAPRTLPAQIARTFGSGTDVTIVRCTRAITAPPVRITPDAARPGRAGGSAADSAALIEPPHADRAVYTCTVIVEGKTPVAVRKDRKKTHAVRHGKKGCGIGTGAGGGQGIGCHPW